MQLSVGAIADILQTRPLYSKALSEEERDALARVMVRGASIDSRTVSEGDLFVCLKGEKVDGHAYAARACEAGAAAILASRDIEGLHEAFPTVPLFVVENPEKALDIRPNRCYNNYRCSAEAQNFIWRSRLAWFMAHDWNSCMG